MVGNITNAVNKAGGLGQWAVYFFRCLPILCPIKQKSRLFYCSSKGLLRSMLLKAAELFVSWAQSWSSSESEEVKYEIIKTLFPSSSFFLLLLILHQMHFLFGRENKKMFFKENWTSFSDACPTAYIESDERRRRFWKEWQSVCIIYSTRKRDQILLGQKLGGRGCGVLQILFLEWVKILSGYQAHFYSLVIFSIKKAQLTIYYFGILKTRLLMASFSLILTFLFIYQ